MEKSSYMEDCRSVLPLCFWDEALELEKVFWEIEHIKHKLGETKAKREMVEGITKLLVGVLEFVEEVKKALEENFPPSRYALEELLEKARRLRGELDLEHILEKQLYCVEGDPEEVCSFAGEIAKQLKEIKPSELVLRIMDKIKGISMTVKKHYQFLSNKLEDLEEKTKELKDYLTSSSEVKSIGEYLEKCRSTLKSLKEEEALLKNKLEEAEEKKRGITEKLFREGQRKCAEHLADSLIKGLERLESQGSLVLWELLNRDCTFLAGFSLTDFVCNYFYCIAKKILSPNTGKDKKKKAKLLNLPPDTGLELKKTGDGLPVVDRFIPFYTPHNSSPIPEGIEQGFLEWSIRRVRAVLDKLRGLLTRELEEFLPYFVFEEDIKRIWEFHDIAFYGVVYVDEDLKIKSSIKDWFRKCLMEIMRDLLDFEGVARVIIDEVVSALRSVVEEEKPETLLELKKHFFNRLVQSRELIEKMLGALTRKIKGRKREELVEAIAEHLSFGEPS